MEVLDVKEEKLSREQQIRIIGILAELRDKVDKENMRSRINFRTCSKGVSAQHVEKWTSEMIQRLEEMRKIVHS